MKEDLKSWFKGIYFATTDPLAEQKELINYDVRNSVAKEDKTHLFTEIIDPTIIKFYTARNLWKIEWNTKENVDFNAQGTFDFITIEQVMQDSWDEELGGNDWAPDMKGFRPLDMFYDMDGMVGFFINRPEKTGLYLLHSDSSMSALNVDMEGYLQLLVMSKGFGWWQNALVQISKGEEMPNVASFKENMPKIFPDFSWEAFEELYESVRIDK